MNGHRDGIAHCHGCRAGQVHDLFRRAIGSQDHAHVNAHAVRGLKTASKTATACGLVIGNEGEGVGRLVKEKCDMVASIPMKGDIDSLNASVAAGVLAYEIVRQRLG